MIRHRAIDRDATVVLRPAAPRDIEHLADLARQNAEYQRTLAPWIELLPDVDWRRYIAQKLAPRDARLLLVATRNDVPVGYAELRIIDQAWQPRVSLLRALVRRIARPRGEELVPTARPRRLGFIDDLYVEPAARSPDVSGALMRAAFDWFRTQQVSEIEAAIWADNRTARRLAHWAGFETVRILVRKKL